MDEALERNRFFIEMIRPVLAQEIAEDFFQPGREEELHAHVTRIVETYLRSRKLPRTGTLRKALVDVLMADIDRSGRQGLKAYAEEDPADKFVRMFKDLIRPALVNGIHDDFFQPGREEELKKRVVEIVDARLIRDKVPIGRQLRISLIVSLLADIERAKKERLGPRP